MLKRPATYEDLRQVPAHLIAEIIDGDLYATPRPAPKHTNASSVLGVQIGGPFHLGRDGPGGWWILDEPELHVGGDILVPDLAGWRRHRLPGLPDTAAFTLAPDWVCEIVSASTEALDRGKKLAIYAREAVPHFWIINPDNQTLEIYALAAGRWTVAGTHVGDVLVRAEPFEAIELDLSALWTD